MNRRGQFGSILGYTLMAVACLGVALWLSVNLLQQTLLRVENAKRHLALTSKATHLNAAWSSIARQRIQAGNPLIYEAATAGAAVSLLDNALDSFAVSDYAPPSTPPLFASNQFTQDSPRVDGLGDMWHVDHLDTAAYELTYADGRGKAASSNSWSPALREVPLSQVGLAAIEQLSLVELTYPVTVNGAVLLPWGYSGGSAQLSAARLISPIPADGAVAAAESFIRPGLAVGYSTGIYLPLSSGSNSPVQALQARGGHLAWDGLTIIDGTPPSGVVVENYDGEKRLIIDLTLIPTANTKLSDSDPSNNVSVWTIDCTTPLAKSRGVVVVGDNGLGARPRDMLVTNGYVRLVGQHGSPFALSSSYGAVAFESPSPSPAWTAHLSLPVGPPQLVASSTGTGAAIDTSGPGNYPTNILTRSSNAVELRATMDRATRMGFSATEGSAVADLFAEYLPDTGLNLWAADESGVAHILQTIPYVSSGQVHVTLRYERAVNLVTVTIDGISVSMSLPSGTQPRFETAGVCWSAAMPALSVAVRVGGARLYAVGSAATPSIQGLLVGGGLSGNLSGLTINPTLSPPLLALTERALIFIEPNAL